MKPEPTNPLQEMMLLPNLAAHTQICLELKNKNITRNYLLLTTYFHPHNSPSCLPHGRAGEHPRCEASALILV